jgi:DNA-binding NarL/FixJ family response regulator
LSLSLHDNHSSLDTITAFVAAHYARFWWLKEVDDLKELKVFVADDSQAIRQQLQSALSKIEGCSLIGSADGNLQAAQLINNLQPDVVILDISMPHREGIRVLREIRKVIPLAQVIIYTADPSVVLQEVCLEAGANFYLDKTQIQDLIDILSERLVQNLKH